MTRRAPGKAREVRIVAMNRNAVVLGLLTVGIVLLWRTRALLTLAIAVILGEAPQLVTASGHLNHNIIQSFQAHKKLERAYQESVSQSYKCWTSCSSQCNWLDMLLSAVLDLWIWGVSPVFPISEATAEHGTLPGLCCGRSAPHWGSGGLPCSSWHADHGEVHQRLFITTRVGH